MSTLWPLILDQRAPYTKNWLHCLFTKPPSSLQWEFLETRQKGWQKKTRSKNEMDKNKKQEKRDKKQETKGKGLKTINERKWTKGVGRCPLETDQI